MKHHRPKYDRWLVAVLALGAVVSLALPALLWASVPAAARPMLLGTLALDFVVIAFVVWLVAAIRYELSESDLVVRFGPFRITVPLQGIDEIFPTKNPLSAPAPSLDRLQINYRVGERRRVVLVSPKDKAAFLEDVAAAGRGLSVQGDRVVRRGR